MRSIGVRITLWYALTATASLGCLFVAGYYLLEDRLLYGLDLLNSAEAKEIKAYLGTDSKALVPGVIDQRIRKTAEFASVLFYIQVQSPQTGESFRSSNLSGHAIPDVTRNTRYIADIADIGELRISRIVMPPFYVLIGTPFVHVREALHRYVEVCVALLIAMMLISIGIGFGMSRLVLRPMRAIRETANRIRSDNLSERIPVADVRDEISDLARLLNQMFDRLEASFDQIRRFTADASHELKTPLSLVRLHAEKMLMSGQLAASQEDAVQIQLEEINRLNKIVDDLLFLSRADAQVVKRNFQLQDGDEFLKSFVQDAAVLVEHHDRRFSWFIDDPHKIAFEPKWLRQVLLNLVANAIKATPVGGLITLRSALTGEIWRISVENEGPNLTAGQRERIFERFVRFNQSDGDDGGSGLGLAICRSIIELHRGHIFALQRSDGPGIEIVIEIPAVRATRA